MESGTFGLAKSNNTHLGNARVKSKRITFCEELPNQSSDCQDVLSELLIADEDKRIDMDALMKHPWVNDNYPRLEPACDSNINQDLDIDIVALEVNIT